MIYRLVPILLALALAGSLSAQNFTNVSAPTILATDPATCGPSQWYFNSTTNTFRGCATTNTWVGFVTAYPGAGIANSTGSAWGTSYTTTGSGTVVALKTSPSFTTPSIDVATGTSLALGGATIGSNALAVTGTMLISGQLTSTLSTGTAPFSVTSTTQVANLNAATLGGINLGTPVAGGIAYGTSTTQIGTTAALTQYGVVFSGGTGAPTSSAQGAANMPLIGQGAANPIFSTIGYPTSLTAGGTLYGSSTTQLANLATTAYSVHVSGATNPSWATPTGNGQCFMSGASSYATTTPSFQTCPGGNTLGVATATSLAIGGATIGSDALAVTGTMTISGIINGGTIRQYGASFGTPGGTALSTGGIQYFNMPQACTIKGYEITADAGTATVKFWKIAAGTAIPTVSNNINTSGVALSSGTHIKSTTTSDFTTTTVTADDIGAVTVTAVSGAGYVQAVMLCQ